MKNAKQPAISRVIASLVIAASALLPGSASAADCGSSPGGPPNSCPGVASTGGNGGPDAGVGNPINVMTGNKYEREVDMPALPGVLGLEIIRHYNSAYAAPRHQNGAVGRGWRLSYETELFDMYGKIQIMQADGGRVIFDRDQKNTNLCSTRNPANGTMALVPQKNGAREYVWTWTNGRKLFFDTEGKLYRIAAPTGEFVLIDYDQRKVLRRVTDPQGRRLDLAYFDPKLTSHFRGVQFIDSPVGRFEYQYGSAPPKGSDTVDVRNLLALLVKVKLPTRFEPDKPAHPLTSRGTTTSQISRLYHHEDPKSPWLLTGISVETTGADRKPVATRYSTYGYDSDGRAVLSTHANNVNKVTLDNHAFGKTVLTNSLGQKTTYMHAVIAGEHRLLEVRGAGCALCGETNVRYGYNPVGQLLEMTRLAPDGAPVTATRTDYDKLGRVARIGKLAYVQGKAQPVQWMVRFAYPRDSFAASVITRPSVVPGKEAVTRIAYNAVGQPLSVTDIGYAPTFDGMQSAGQLERTTRYRYTKINGWSFLTEIDGPLPNGKTGTPADSDITVIEYDKRSNGWAPPTQRLRADGIAEYDPLLDRAGVLTRMIAPGGFITDLLERDQAQRPTKIRTTDGDLVHVATVSHNWRGAPLDIDLTAGTLRRHLHYDYNAEGQVTGITLPGNLRTAFQYDQAGRMEKTTLPDGSGLLTLQDTEGHTARIARYLAVTGTISADLPDVQFDYERPVDQPGRLTRTRDALGVSSKYRYNEVGQIAAITNALGAVSSRDYDAAGLLAQRTDAADSAAAATTALRYDNAGNAIHITAANGVATMRRYDDFGQKIMEADPDHGITLFRYDAAGHMVARIDEAMVTTRFTFDHAKRLLAVGADKQPNLMQYQYRGRQLTNMISTSDGDPEHATERTTYERDALGQVIRETRWIANVSTVRGTGTNTSQGVTFITANAYDDVGRLVNQTLPDGHRLQYRYAAAGASGARPGHRPGQLAAILFDDRIIVTDIEQTIAGGLTGYTMGNGLRQKIRLDRRGRIEELQVARSSPDGLWHRIAALFSEVHPTTSEIYRQVNRYDKGNRIVQIERQSASASASADNALQTGIERYAYDEMDRLTAITDNNGIATTFQYDKGGNRVAEAIGPSHGDQGRTRTRGVDVTDSTFHYATGSNRLMAVVQKSSGEFAKQSASLPMDALLKGTPGTEQTMRSAWLYHPTGVQLAQLQWMRNDGPATRRIIYNSAKRPVAVYENDQLVARYYYNSRGERIGKTVYPVRRPSTKVAYKPTAPQGVTTYSLYRDQRLAAETDAAGKITAHFIYLYGKPVAKIEMAPNTSVMHRLWKAIGWCAMLDASDTMASIYAIITDQLGTPQQVSNERQELVWQGQTTAFGQARVTYARNSKLSAPAFEMNLRLPGQIFDNETGLNYNYLRDYDPEVGRYTRPDPAGLGGGSNPYVYVSNNPLANVDPLGLYQIDVHYYMTFFLAITAGVDESTARRIALATQYIDENPVTEPMLPGSSLEDYFDSIFINKPALIRYHFVQAGYDPERTTAEKAFHLVFGYDTASYAAMRIKNPSSPQLSRLLAATEFSKRDPNANCNSSAQLFGEYLHAFEDAFAHRDENNEPYSPTAIGLGIGHGADIENPDYTYNHTSGILGLGTKWSKNEDRTFEMEKEVFEKIGKFTTPKNYTTPFSKLERILKDFNGFHAQTSSKNFSEKIAILNEGLKGLGYENIDMSLGSERYGFNLALAAKNRSDALNGLKPTDYPGLILPQGATRLPEEQ
jgi:RHS repeat-associated protein